MALFFAGVMPTMLYTIGLVAFMLRWLAKGRGQVRRVSIGQGGDGATASIRRQSTEELLGDSQDCGAMVATTGRWSEARLRGMTASLTTRSPDTQI